MATHKPYIGSDDIEAGAGDAAIEWMSYLSTTFGTGGALQALHYYERLGWLSDDARERLTGYLRGLDTATLHNKTHDEPETLDGPLAMFSGTAFSSHARSLVYIARIGEDDLEEHVLTSRLAEHRAERESTVE